MFLEPERLAALRAAIEGDVDRLEAVQREDFVEWFRAAGDKPIRFRLLDAPPSEFLPPDHPLAKRHALRALRLFAARPDIERAQLRALADAWRKTTPPQPLSIIMPMVTGQSELEAAIARAKEHAADVPLTISAMMELPRAALRADRIAPLVKSFSWGSKDLTQFTLCLSRSVAPAIVPQLVGAGALPWDPNETIDESVARVMAHAERIGRAANPSLVTGVCGRIAADPRSIRFFHSLGMNYVSVPPNQIGAARIAAAQAQLAGSTRPWKM
jgi:pyruvate,orthophosphate dikinase